MDDINGFGSRFSYAEFKLKTKLSALAHKLSGKRPYPNNVGGMPVLTPAEGGREISSAIERGNGFVAGRIGTTELSVLHQAVEIRLGLRRSYSDEVCRNVKLYSGVFPAAKETAEKFSRLMFECLPDVDLFAQLGYIDYLKRFCAPDSKIAKLHCLEPYYLEVPWSKSLEHRKVLVVHPFADTIESQYRKRHLLFKCKDVLPEFDLKTFAPVQSVAFAEVSYATWFDALDSMTAKIAALDFDVALIGAGAYGLPLAVRIKQMGKVAIHIGGPTQVLFGIKGKRWDEHPLVSPLYNEYWVRPGDAEKPEGFQHVEGGCYW